MIWNFYSAFFRCEYDRKGFINQVPRVIMRTASAWHTRKAFGRSISLGRPKPEISKGQLSGRKSGESKTYERMHVIFRQTILLDRLKSFRLCQS